MYKFGSLKNKYYPKFLLIFGLVLLFGFGCRGPSNEEQAAVRPVTINYWTVYNNISELERFAQAYKQIRPYVTVNIRQVRYDEFDNLFLNALADDVAPDIVSIHNRDLRQYQSRLSPMPSAVQVANVYTQGKIQPETVIELLQERLPSVSNIRSQYVKTVAEDVVVGSSAYGLPIAVDTLALYYNKDLLDRSGVALPPSTWTEFLEAANKANIFGANGEILQSGVAMGTGKNVENSFDILSMLMMQNDVQMARGNFVTFAEGLNQRGVTEQHPALQALRFYTDFARPDKEAYGWNASQDSAYNAFIRGRAVFYFGFGYDYPRIRSAAPQLNIEVLQVPQLNPSKPANVASYWVEAVPRKSIHKDEAWDFVRFLSLPDNIKAYTKNTNQPSPLRIHIAEQSADPALVPFSSQVLFAENWYRGRDVKAASNAFRSLIDNSLQPYPADETPFGRDAKLINTTAQIIQQTM